MTNEMIANIMEMSEKDWLNPKVVIDRYPEKIVDPATNTSARISWPYFANSIEETMSTKTTSNTT
jgi:hypothetical protein